jgi:uncharacterized secreted protein with C-terminal beta-propeller domain
MIRTRLTFAIIAMLMASVRCAGPTDPQPLQRFDTCTDLQLYLEDQILHPGVEADTGNVALAGCASSADLSGSVGGEGEGEKGATNFTTTNTQTPAVDEPDFVKNDGEFIFVLRRGEMTIVKAWPPEDMGILSHTTIAGVPFTMLFEGNTALVVSRMFSDRAQTMIKIFDVADKANPKELRTTLVDGDFVDARAVNGKVMLVTRALVAPDVELDTAPFSDDANRARLRAAGIANLMPRTSDFVDGVDVSPRSDPAVACENTYAPRESDGHSLLLINGFDMNDPGAPLLSTGVVAGFGHIYASTTSLYLASTETNDGGYFTPPFATTRLHVLDAFTGHNGAAEYKATGVVDGQIKDELSLDEGPDKSLRMIVTDNSQSTDATQQSTSLVVLERSGTHLDEVARVDDIGRGEAVESVRFLGNRAYVSTYPANAPFSLDDQGLPTIVFTDPLTVLDLSDPKNPRERGHVDVGGYSAYIHPLDDDHIVTVGVDTNASTGQETALSLLVFDVGDADHPSLAFRTDVGDQATGSQALVDRHAFTYFDEEKTLGLPIAQFDARTGALTSSSLAVFTVDAQQGIALLGNIEQSPLYTLLSDANTGNGPCATVRRSVMMSDPSLGAFAYAVSTAGITAAKLAPGVDLVKSVALANSGDTACDATGGPL